MHIKTNNRRLKMKSTDEHKNKAEILPRGSWNIDNHHCVIWDFMPYFLLITHAFISLLIQICMKYLLVDISFHAASPYVRE